MARMPNSGYSVSSTRFSFNAEAKLLTLSEEFQCFIKSCTLFHQGRNNAVIEWRRHKRKIAKNSAPLMVVVTSVPELTRSNAHSSLNVQGCSAAHSPCRRCSAITQKWCLVQSNVCFRAEWFHHKQESFKCSVAIGNPERHVRKASHRGSKQQ